MITVLNKCLMSLNLQVNINIKNVKTNITIVTVNIQLKSYVIPNVYPKILKTNNKIININNTLKK